MKRFGIFQFLTLAYLIFSLILNVVNILALEMSCGIFSCIGIIYFMFVFLLFTCTSFLFTDGFLKETLSSESINFLKGTYLFIILIVFIVAVVLDLPESCTALKLLGN